MFWVGYSTLWCVLLGLPYPPPHLGIPAAAGSAGAISFAIYFMFPADWRNDGAFLRRSIWLWLANMFFWILLLSYAIVLFLFNKVSEEYQPLLAILIVFIREIGMLLLKISLWFSLIV